MFVVAPRSGKKDARGARGKEAYGLRQERPSDPNLSCSPNGFGWRTTRVELAAATATRQEIMRPGRHGRESGRFPVNPRDSIHYPGMSFGANLNLLPALLRANYRRH